MKYFLSLALVSILFSSCSDFGTKLKYGKGELYYTKNVTEAQASKLGTYLKEQQFFTDERKISVQLDKSSDTFLFRMVVLDSFLNNPGYLDMARTFTGELSENVFEKKPVVIHFCDNKLKTERVIKPGE